MNRTLQKACEVSLHNDFTHVLEFGVYKGGTLKQLSKFYNSTVHGFDSFEGLPEDWVGTNHKKGGMSAGGRIPEIPNCKIWKGWFENTIPEYLKEYKGPIKLLHIDCDLYSSTKTILELLNDNIVSGTILCFDEWYYNHNPKYKDHEQKAFFEWIGDREFVLELPIEDERQIVHIL